jgi:ribosomal protein L37E
MAEAREPPSFVCPRCGAKSYHPKDISEGYCGRCHDFTGKERPMHTKDMLAAALREVRLHTMADKAATGYYHDFLSPLDLPEMQLITELGVAATARPAQAAAIMELRDRVMDGDFDASVEESEEWAASAEGQETFRKLAKPMR